MRKYSTIDPLLLSFYSKSLYRDVFRDWGRISFLYLFLLVAVSLIPSVLRISSLFSVQVFEENKKIVAQLPEMVVEKGKLSVQGEKQQIIRDPDRNVPVVIIDVSGQFTSLEGSEALILMTEDALFVRTGEAGSRRFDFAGIDYLRIDRASVYDWMETITDYLPVILYPFALIFSYALRMLQALVCAGIGLYVAKGLGIPARYSAMTSLAIVSMTPAIILTAIFQFLMVAIPLWWFINLMIGLGYLYFGIRANAGEPSGE